MGIRALKTVYTGGTFDTPHIGHAAFLYECSKFGEVVVSLNTDDFVERYKGAKPIFSYDERKALLLTLPYVKAVIRNTGGEDSKNAITTISPDFIIVGSDWKDKDYYKQMGFTQDWLDEQDIKLVYLPYTQGISSTLIKQRLCQK